MLAALVTGAVTAQPAGATTVEDTFTAKLNHARTSRGIPALHVRASLVRVARAQAARMASRSVLHLATRTSRRMSRTGAGSARSPGYGRGATSVHNAFMHSPPHKANILDRDYTQVGIGAVVKNGRVWVAEVFRRPTTQASYASFTHTLKFGSTGAAVKRVQVRLGVRPTGWYGVATRRAVSHYQRSLGWAGHGAVGPKTWHRLF